MSVDEMLAWNVRKGIETVCDLIDATKPPPVRPGETAEEYGARLLTDLRSSLTAAADAVLGHE